MSLGDRFVLTLLTNDPELARRADAGGVNRIGLDFEQLGKAERQAQLNTWISDHQFDQLESIRSVLKNARMFVRTNPIHAGLKQEIESFIAAGAQVLMLPMFHSARNAAQFVDCIEGRAEVSLLVETPVSAMRIHDIVRVKGIDEIHIGLNDMHLGMGLRSHFEVLVSDFMVTLSQVVRDAGIAFGFGGIGRVGDSRLPIPSDLVYAQYPLLKADRALVSRVFHHPDPEAIDFRLEVQQFRQRMDYWKSRDERTLQAAREQLRDLVSVR